MSDKPAKTYPRFKPELEQTLRDFAAELKALCRDFSDLRDRPYMGDVHSAVEGMLEQFIATQEPPAEQPIGEVMTWQGLNSVGKIVCEWVEGAPPPEMVSLCGDPSGLGKIERTQIVSHTPLADEAAKAFAKGFNTLEAGGGKYRINMQFQSREDAWGAFNVLAHLKQLNTPQ